MPVALAACTVLYIASLAGSGEYSQAKALMIAAPLAMLIAIRPLLFEAGGDASTMRRGLGRACAVAFVGGAVYSSLLVLRDAPVGPPGHGSELQAFIPIVRGEPVLYAGQDRYAAYELMGADTHVPLVEFPDADVSPSPEKPFDTGDAYSPIDFDSFSHGTLERFPYVITGRAAWNSEAPAGFKRVAATPSYILWKRTGAPPENRHVLLEGTEPAAHADCASPEIRILTRQRRPRLALPGRRDRRQGSLEPRGGTRSRPERLADAAPARRPLAPLDPVLLPLRPDPERARLRPGAAGRARRPAAQHDQPRQRGPVLAGRRSPQQRPADPLHDHRRRAEHAAAADRLLGQGDPGRAGRGAGASRTASCR